MKISLFILLAFISLTQVACKGLNFDQYERGDLVSSKLLSSHSLKTMKSVWSISRYSAKYPVKAYKITYETIDDEGDDIRASGLLVVPQKSLRRRSPLFVHHHGTITQNTRAPSYQHKATHILSKTASLGYIVIAPDYLGYGKSDNINHPYLHAKTLASSSVDMLRASKEWLKKHRIRSNDQLFLEGYSEGGYAAMATHKEIEKHYDDDFTVTASAPAAGPYDLSTTARTLLLEDRLEFPTSIAFVIKAYDDLYSSNLVNDAIKPNYRNIVNNFINDGDYSSREIDKLLGNRTDRFLRGDFINDIRDETETELTDSLRKNNIYNWKPKAPIRLIHGKDDKIVPYANSVKAVDKMIARGATDIELIDCDLAIARHHVCSVFAYDYSLIFFYGLADDL